MYNYFMMGFVATFYQFNKQIMKATFWFPIFFSHPKKLKQMQQANESDIINVN